MDKFDYITATIEEEKVRLEKIIEYFEDNNINNDDLLEYKERYNNVCRYLTLKGKYLNIRKRIDSFKGKLEELNETKDEYEVDNILLEDTLLSNFNSDTMGKYRNILYEDIKKEDPSIRDILYLLFEKESDYNNLVTKRTKLLKLINQNTYPKTYNTLISQDALIDKQHSILDDIFILENNIKIEEDKISKIEDEAMVVPILKILYEFWITNSYDPKKVDKTKIFIDNKNFITLKNNIDKEDNTSKKETSTKIQETKSNIETISNLNLPGINEDNLVNINGKDYIKSDN
ncbi:MAG: hypothetical protein SPF04_02065 [Bacilli bacterium]|nr:hypothetical protein [Bacilli bacterium]MDY5995996.1 hypothetical protein [Bacilli bacterium]